MTMHFDLVDLRVFVAVSEENSFTAGAERAHLSVPSASTRIKNLEESIGCKLLHRGSQGVSLTLEGHTFLHHAQRVLDEAEQLRAGMARFTTGGRGNVTIAANTTAATEFLPHDLRTFLADHPNVTISLKEQHNDEVVRAVSSGKADIGIVVGDVHSASLTLHHYRTDRLVLIAPTAHPLAERTSVGFVDAIDYDFVGMPQSSSIHTFLVREAIRLKRQLRVRIEVGNFEALCRLVEARAGVAVFSRSVAVRYARRFAIRIVELEDSWALREHVICVRSGETLPSFALALLMHLRQAGPAATLASAQSVPIRD